MPNAWAKRLLHLGGTGFDGVIPDLNVNVGELQGGYALTASNGGHRDPTRGAARFLDNPTLVDDYAHVAIQKTVRVAKTLRGFPSRHRQDETRKTRGCIRRQVCSIASAARA